MGGLWFYFRAKTISFASRPYSLCIDDDMTRHQPLDTRPPRQAMLHATLTTTTTDDDNINFHHCHYDMITTGQTLKWVYAAVRRVLVGCRLVADSRVIGCYWLDGWMNGTVTR